LAPRLEAWFFDRAGKHGYVHHLYGLYPLIEMFLGGDHGYVLGYQHRDGRVHPVLGKEPVEAIEWGLPLLWSTTEAFVDALILEADLVNLWSDARPAVKDVLDLFWRHPTDEEVAAWGSFPHAAEQTHSHYARLAEPVRLTWLLESTRSYRLSLRPQSTWPAGTAAASAAPFRGLLAFRLWLYDEVPRLRRRQWLSEQFTLLIELATY
jgi:hypothetical protein